MLMHFKKFSFFQESLSHEDGSLEAACCAASSWQTAYIGLSNGFVKTFDRNLDECGSFRAHSSGLFQLQSVQGEKGLLTVGYDDRLSASVLKLWDVNKIRSTAGAKEQASFALFGRAAGAAQKDVTEGECSAFAVFEESDASRRCHVAIGLSTGFVLYFLVDFAKERQQPVRRWMSMRNERSDLWSVTGLVFTRDEDGLHLFAVSESEVRCFEINDKQQDGPLAGSILDDKGAIPGCTAQDAAGTVVVAQGNQSAASQADTSIEVAREFRGKLQLYNPETKTACHLIDEEPVLAASLRNYYITVEKMTDAHGVDVFTLGAYDFRTKMQACCKQGRALTLPSRPRFVLTAWSRIVLLLRPTTPDDAPRLVMLSEVDLQEKLKQMVQRRLYKEALVVAEDSNDPAVVAEVRRQYGDHLANQSQDYAAAMEQYVHTIGFLEPSHVIRKFLEPQRIGSLTSYLEALHEAGLATADHTTLLLNCYTKLKAEDKLEQFVQQESAERFAFDTDTAIKTLCASNYPHLAQVVASNAGQHDKVLEILIDERGEYMQALEYMQAHMTRRQQALAMQRLGGKLVNNEQVSVEASKVLMILCTPNDAVATASYRSTATSDEEIEERFIASIADFTHLFTDKPGGLILLGYHVLTVFGLETNQHLKPPNEQELYHTMLQLLLPKQFSVQDKDLETAEARRQKGEELLKEGWAPGVMWPLTKDSDAEHLKYDPEHALMLCRVHAFEAGLLLLYDRMQRFREVLQVHMAAGNTRAVLESARMYSELAPVKASQLWTLALEYIADQEEPDEEDIQMVLREMETRRLLPATIVLQTLSRNRALKLSTVRSYIERQLNADSAAIKADRGEIERIKAQTNEMREQLKELRDKPQVFKATREYKTGAPLQLPVIHFWCGHSYNLASLSEGPDQTYTCPACEKEFNRVQMIQSARQTGMEQQSSFFRELRNASDGFGVIAQYFGRGMM